MAENKWAILGGLALNVEYPRKYGFDATAAAKVTAKLVAVPPPTLFQEAIQADIAGRVRRAAISTAPVLRPPTVLPTISPPATSPAAGVPSEFYSPPVLDTDEEFSTLSLIVEDKAGVAYTLDDGVTPPSEGVVAEDGALIHRVSKESEGCVITFADGSEPLELIFDDDSSDAEDYYASDEYAEDWAEHLEAAEYAAEELEEPEDESDESVDYEEMEALIDSRVEEDERVVSLVLPEYAGKSYTLSYPLDEDIYTSQGVIDEDGLLLHPVSPEAEGCTIEIDGEPEKLELIFSEEDFLEGDFSEEDFLEEDSSEEDDVEEDDVD